MLDYNAESRFLVDDVVQHPCVVVLPQIQRTNDPKVPGTTTSNQKDGIETAILQITCHCFIDEDTVCASSSSGGTHHFSVRVHYG